MGPEDPSDWAALEGRPEMDNWAGWVPEVPASDREAQAVKADRLFPEALRNQSYPASIATLALSTLASNFEAYRTACIPRDF